MLKDEMLARYEVLYFAYGFCVVKDRQTGERGTLEFAGNPRQYFGWQPA